MPVRTTFFSRHREGGSYEYFDLPRHPGSIFFVGSTHAAAADNTGCGRTPDQPFATITYALAQCTASAGDVIYLLPGHVSLVAAAAGLVFNVAGVSVIGCGNGTIQPIIRFTTGIGADMDILCPVTFENINFQAGFADVTAAIDIDSTDVTFRRCRFSQQAVDLNCVRWIALPADTTASRLTIEDCRMIAYDAVNDAFIDYTDTGDGHIFRRNTLLGDWDVAAVGGAGIITNAIVCDNDMYNYSNTVDGCISFAATATGVCMNNYVGSLAAQANQILATGMAKCENFGAVVAEDLQGLAEPARA